MQEAYPHEIKYFTNGDRIPDGYMELTEEQFKAVDLMTPIERASWFVENGTLSAEERVRRMFKGTRADPTGRVREEYERSYEGVMAANKERRMTGKRTPHPDTKDRLRDAFGKQNFK